MHFLCYRFSIVNYSVPWYLQIKVCGKRLRKTIVFVEYLPLGPYIFDASYHYISLSGLTGRARKHILGNYLFLLNIGCTYHQLLPV